MGDKTQLLAFSLSAKFRRPGPILAGIFVATLVNHALAAALGEWIAGHVDPRILGGVLGLGFIAFAMWTLIPDRLEPDATPPKYGPFATTTALFFLAEMGDKTQIATAALAARFHSLVLVIAGTTAAMMAADGLAVLLGERLSRWMSPALMRKIAAALFLVTGAWTLFETFRPGAHHPGA